MSSPFSAQRAGIALGSALLLLAGGAAAAVPAQAAPSDSSPSGNPAPRLIALEHNEGVKVARKATATLSAPSSVKTGASIKITGKVKVAAGKKAKPRAVNLVEKVGNKWKRVASKKTNKKGAFTFTIGAGSAVKKRVFRVEAPAVRKLKLKKVTTPSRTVSVITAVPPLRVFNNLKWLTEYTPQGSASDWSYLYEDDQAAWDHCTAFNPETFARVIKWSYNPAGQRYAALSDLKKAFARVAEGTDYEFEYVGTTTADGFDPSKTADIVAIWTDQRDYPELAGITVGLGEAYVYDNEPEVIVGGLLMLDRDETRLAAGFGDSASDPVTWGQTMTHEILHVMGLGHADGRNQLMSPYLSTYNHRFGAGDVTGMQRVGGNRPC